MMIRESFRGLNNTSALMRFKTLNGYNKTEHVKVGGYIAMKKIKRALEEEFTDELFAEFVKEHGFVKGARGRSNKSRVDNDKRYRINKFLSNLDKWPSHVIEAIYRIYLDKDHGGIKALVNELAKPKFVLTRLMRAEA